MTEDEAVVASVIGFADRGIDTHLGGHPGDDELLDATVLENGVQIGGEESAFARLVNDWLGRQRVKFWNDIVSGFAAHQDTAHWAGIANAGLAPTTDFLGWW